MTVNIFGIPRFKNYSQRSIRTTVNRLKNKGIIKKNQMVSLFQNMGRNMSEKKLIH